MGLSIQSGQWDRSTTQHTPDGSCQVKVKGGVGPFSIRVFSYMTGQFTIWYDADANDERRLEVPGLMAGSYSYEIFDAGDGNGVLHPYSMIGRVRAEYVIEEHKNDGAVYVQHPVDNVIYEFTSFNEESISINKIDVMLENSTYHDADIEYTAYYSGCFYNFDELPKTEFDEWGIPTFEDYMYILNQIPDLTPQGIKDFFESTLNISYDGYVEGGYELNGGHIDDRHLFEGTYGQFWINHYVFKNRFNLSMRKLDIDSASALQLLTRPCADEFTSPNFMLQCRLVRRTGEITLNEYTILDGWNFITLPETFEEGTPEDIFGGDTEKVYFIKSMGEDPNVKMWWPAFGIDTLDKLLPGETYAIRAIDNFRFDL